MQNLPHYLFWVSVNFGSIAARNPLSCLVKFLKSMRKMKGFSLVNIFSNDSHRGRVIQQNCHQSVQQRGESKKQNLLTHNFHAIKRIRYNEGISFDSFHWQNHLVVQGVATICKTPVDRRNDYDVKENCRQRPPSCCLNPNDWCCYGVVLIEGGGWGV